MKDLITEIVQAIVDQPEEVSADENEVTEEEQVPEDKLADDVPQDSGDQPE